MFAFVFSILSNELSLVLRTIWPSGELSFLRITGKRDWFPAIASTTATYPRDLLHALPVGALNIPRIFIGTASKASIKSHRGTRC
jgi:hypothetical protein